MTAWNEHDPVEAARRLGHDLYVGTRLPKHTGWPEAVQEGFSAAAFDGLARRTPDRFERKWLQLRLGACRRGRIVDDDVTVDLLRELDLTHCPVTREPLTHGERADTDWSVDRLNNDAAYAASNLAVMSTRANRAKGARRFEEALALSTREVPTDGLTPVQWLRLAVLMLGPAFATRPHDAPPLPLCAPLPSRAVRLAQQQIQRLFIVNARRPAGKNRLVRDLLPACASERSRLRLRRLADILHEGLKRPQDDQACWDAWLVPEAMPALTAWRESLDAEGWGRAAAVAGRLAGARRETPRRLQAWCLPSQGYHLGWLPRPRAFA
ncbi:hypothetical protein V4F39_04960 [Aquincola sp. MAHUQ-54]|uniref:Uncharacterized protein n=1 Tax=Aquincola agrisoli TaxID=3119538 RepID=A0AAW9Q1L8_9BURK